MLTSNDNTVLAQIFDPEAAPSGNVVIDPSLPEDPVVQNNEIRLKIRQYEKHIIRSVESILNNSPQLRTQGLEQGRADLESLLESYPESASLLNDYAQIVRLQFGDQLLVASTATADIASRTLDSLNKAISLLTPSNPQAAVSPPQARTLGQAHTQRGALLHGASKATISNPCLKVIVPSLRGFAAVDLAEAASRDFFMGGRYGNEVAKGLAVHTNPTAKLCGQMVQDAMRREFAPQLQEI
ncbi:MAG: hypothetical protein LQ340_001298 [Diploschistes diacapsis]|nr:MAG: hypothetical protein LQ340_001298 [Diploschistes diacapsis]